MKKTPTFQEQYNKITSAYYKDELKPMNGCACFVGNLLNNNGAWEGTRCYLENRLNDMELPRAKHGRYQISIESGGLYTPEDILLMEHNFLRKCFDTNLNMFRQSGIATEERLFEAMVSTLELLRKLHESKGEVVKDYHFTKREIIHVQFI